MKFRCIEINLYFAKITVMQKYHTYEKAFVGRSILPILWEVYGPDLKTYHLNLVQILTADHQPLQDGIVCPMDCCACRHLFYNPFINNRKICDIHRYHNF